MIEAKKIVYHIFQLAVINGNSCRGKKRSHAIKPKPISTIYIILYWDYELVSDSVEMDFFNSYFFNSNSGYFWSDSEFLFVVHFLY